MTNWSALIVDVGRALNRSALMADRRFCSSLALSKQPHGMSWLAGGLAYCAQGKDQPYCAQGKDQPYCAQGKDQPYAE